jgi:hypothetical protein
MKPIKKIVFEVIPPEQQRYKTVGDYWRDPDGTLQIRVSEMNRNEQELLVFFHEAVEVALTEHRGIKEEDISSFDILFEKDRSPGNEDEPGDDEHAPYRREHCTATAVERLMCSELLQSWSKYDQECDRVHRLSGKNNS